MADVKFVFGCSTEVFPVDEFDALLIHGLLLEQLASGSMRPNTTEQEHFLCVDRDEAEPETVLERAWVRLKARREYEALKAPPPLPKEDYGIIEWDREKCWW